MEGFGQRLKDYAKSEHHSVRKWADKIDKQESTISQYINEIRTPGADFLYLLAQLGCDINWLLTGEKLKTESTDEKLDLAAQVTELQNQLKAMSKRIEQLEKKGK